METSLTVSNVPARHKVLKGLTDVYTGEVLDVRLSVGPRIGCVFFASAPKESKRAAPYNHVIYRTPPELMQALSMRDGVGGVVDEDDLLRCPYTGDQLSIRKANGGVRVEGGWNPYFPFRGNAEEFAYKCKLRGGKAPEGAAPEVPFVSAVTDETEPPLEKETLKDVYAEQAENMMNDVESAVKGRTTVSMAAPEKPGAKAPKSSAKAPKSGAKASKSGAKATNSVGD